MIIPSNLHAYTAGASEVDAEGATLGDVLVDLERRFRGIRFRVVDEQDRIRPHVKFFVGQEEARTLAVVVGDEDVQIVAALSGG